MRRINVLAITSPANYSIHHILFIINYIDGFIISINFHLSFADAIVYIKKSTSRQQKEKQNKPQGALAPRNKVTAGSICSTKTQ